MGTTTATDANDTDSTGLTAADGPDGDWSASGERGCDSLAELEHAISTNDGRAAIIDDAWASVAYGYLSTDITSDSIDGTSTSGTAEWVSAASRGDSIA